MDEDTRNGSCQPCGSAEKESKEDRGWLQGQWGREVAHPAVYTDKVILQQTCGQEQPYGEWGRVSPRGAALEGPKVRMWLELAGGGTRL